MAIDPRVRKARAKLERLLAARPEVRLIDVGAEGPGNGVVLRVHLVPGTEASALAIPGAVDGVAVRVVAGEYRVQGTPGRSAC